MNPSIIFSYFPQLTPKQKEQINSLYPIYIEENEKVNVVSRKDIESLYLRHVLHSLSIAKFIQFKSESHITDIGTGGGFPGIPLAILFPSSHFHLVDSRGKKLKVVERVADCLELKNVRVSHQRVEKTEGKCDFVVSRAVASLKQVYEWMNKKIRKEHFNELANGFIFLKGGELKKEINELGRPCSEQSISEYFNEEWFFSKKIIYTSI